MWEASHLHCISLHSAADRLSKTQQQQTTNKQKESSQGVAVPGQLHVHLHLRGLCIFTEAAKGVTLLLIIWTLRIHLRTALRFFYFFSFSFLVVVGGVFFFFFIFLLNINHGADEKARSGTPAARAYEVADQTNWKNVSVYICNSNKWI